MVIVGKRLVATAVTLLVPALATAATISAVPPRAKLVGFQCIKSVDPIGRGVGVTAVMRPLPGTVRMAIKTDLLMQRAPGGRFKPVHGPNLGNWNYPQPPTLGQLPGDVWNSTHDVVGPGLVAPAAYRFRITFRWTGDHGQEIGRKTLLSHVCFLGPDLLVVPPITVSALSASQDSYVAVIRNRGVSAAGPFEVQFSDGSAPPTIVPVPGLAAHKSVKERFVGPACTAAGAPTVTVDPADQVDDYNRANNTLTATCPTAG
jgi:hypothetical protein